MAIRARASHACSSRVCLPANVITAGDTHEQCVACLGAGHAAAAFSEGADCPHCERLPLRTLRSRKSLFVDGIFTSEPRGSLDQSTFEEEEMESVDEPPQSLQYEELLEVVTRAVDKLKIYWPAEQQTESRGSKLGVSCALGRHLRIGACCFFPICILRFVDRGEVRTRPASSFQRLKTITECRGFG